MNYEDLTLLIPVRIDTRQRMENLEGVLEYYHRYGFRILLGEEDVKPKCDFLTYRFPHLDYHFFSSNQTYFYRTQVLNTLIRKATTRYVANYDCDVFFPQEQVDKAIGMLNNGYDVVYPYDGRFYNVLRPHLKDILNNRFDASLRGWVMNASSNGGAIFFNRESYMKGGGENEHFISWGSEDNERFYRFQTLGFKIGRVDGMCYHIDHPRGRNSMDSNPYYRQCQEEYGRVTSMNREQLEKHIKEKGFITY